MFGYYDPESLTVENDHARLSFINAMNADDIHEVRIETRKDAERIKSALRAQRDHAIGVLDGTITRIAGSLRVTEGYPDEGVIIDRENRRTAVKMGFMPQEGELPRDSICVAVGYMQNGALHTAKLLMRPITPAQAPENTPNDQVGPQDEKSAQ